MENCRVPEDLTEEQIKNIAKLVSAQLADAAANAATDQAQLDAATQTDQPA